MLVIAGFASCVPAAAAGGWYLLRPPVAPVSGGGEPVVSDAPLREWDRVGAYDTAPACEAARRELLATFAPLTHDERKMLSPRQTGLVVVAGLAAARSRCVASDDAGLR